MEHRKSLYEAKINLLREAIMKYFSQSYAINEIPSIVKSGRKHLDTNVKHKKFRLFMRFFGPLGNFAAFIQLIKIYHERQVQGISLIAIISTICVVATWSAYGFAIKDKPVLISNSICFVIHIFILIGIIIF